MLKRLKHSNNTQGEVPTSKSNIDCNLFHIKAFSMHLDQILINIFTFLSFQQAQPRPYYNTVKRSMSPSATPNTPGPAPAPAAAQYPPPATWLNYYRGTRYQPPNPAAYGSYAQPPQVCMSFVLFISVLIQVFKCVVFFKPALKNTVLDPPCDYTSKSANY
jgi:hypothetical protein